MLIALVLGGLLLLVVLSAVRFARMEDAGEQAQFARARDRAVIFTGTVSARAARETIPEALLGGFAGERVTITVQRLPEDGSQAGPTESTS